MATPRGVVAFKRFFSRQLATTSGGSCSATNAGLGADYDHVLVIAPAVEGFPGQRGTLDEVADLKAAGVDVVLIHPDGRAKTAIGDNVFDPTRRGPAAEAGRAQGREMAAEVTRVWGAR